MTQPERGESFTDMQAPNTAMQHWGALCNGDLFLSQKWHVGHANDTNLARGVHCMMNTTDMNLQKGGTEYSLISAISR